MALTTLRLLLPQITAALMLVALYVLSDFGTVALMRFETFTTVIYAQIGGRFDPAGAAALSSVLILLTLVLLAAGLRARGGAGFVQTGAGFTGRSPDTGRRRRRWVLLALVALPLLASVGLPLARLGTWTVQTVGDESLGDWAGWALNSLLAATLTATVATALALPVALVVARGARRGAGLGVVAQAGYALPGVIVALAAVAIATRWLDPLYGTLTLLVAAFVVRVLPQAIQGQEAGLQQIGPNLTEAARSLGAGRREAFVAVVLPLLRPALLASWAVVFLTTLKELPVTLILRPIGFDTLAVRVWTPAHDGLYAQAGPAALALVLVSVVPLALVLARRGALLPGPA